MVIAMAQPVVARGARSRKRVQAIKGVILAPCFHGIIAQEQTEFLHRFCRSTIQPNRQSRSGLFRFVIQTGLRAQDI